MNLAFVEKIANAVLYEGYILYPYRPSAVKNRQRWTFGGIYPQPYSLAQGGADAWTMQTECLVVGNAPSFNVKVRFLHLVARKVGELAKPLPELSSDEEPDIRFVHALQVGDRLFQTWQEAVEREITIADLGLNEIIAQTERRPFSFSSRRGLESLRCPTGEIVGVILREQEAIEGAIEIAAERVGDWVYKVAIRILNLTPFEETSKASRDEAIMRSFVSTHTIIGVREGEFVSLIDPPEQFRGIAAKCSNVGTWPVLAGEEGERDAMLSSPIILYDYPQIAPESAGDFFDGTEIDEMLVLRVMTLTDEEKREMRQGDERARALLERTEALSEEQLMKLHGAVRNIRPIEGGQTINSWNPLEEKPKPDYIHVGEVNLKPGDRVRLRPRKGGDVFDVALNGKTAMIESIEQDYEDRIYIAVTVDEDPGKDFGGKRMPGHRFFFSPEEVEPIFDEEI